MKKLGLFLLLAAGMAFAQQDSQQPSAQSSSAQSSTQQTDVGKPTDTDQALFKGCVGGTKDNYTLTDDQGRTFRLHSDKDINEHVGQMVEIRGTVKKEGADKAASAGAMAQQELDVADIKTVSKQCSSDTMNKKQ